MKSFVFTIILLFLIPGVSFSQESNTQAEIKELREKLERLERKLAESEKKAEAERAAIAQKAEKKEEKKTGDEGLLKAKVAGLNVKLGGFVRLDGIASDKNIGAGATPNVGNTPLDNNKQRDHAQTTLDARQSRLRVDITSDEVLGLALSGAIEADFNTTDGNALGSNARHFGLRHAYARADHLASGFYLLGGQYWNILWNQSTVAGLSQVGSSPIGTTPGRQPQFRVGYRMPLGEEMGNLFFEADVEKHSSQNLGSTAVIEDQGEAQPMPLFGGKISWSHPRFRIEVAGAGGRNRVVLNSGGTDSDTAFGFQTSLQVPLAPLAPVTLLGHFQHLEGLGRIAGGGVGSEIFLAGNKVKSVVSNGFYAGARYNFTENTSLEGIFSYHKLDNDAVKGTGQSLATTVETRREFQVSLLHKFWKRWQAGLAYERFHLETFNGTDGNANLGRAALWLFF